MELMSKPKSMPPMVPKAARARRRGRLVRAERVNWVEVLTVDVPYAIHDGWFASVRS